MRIIIFLIIIFFVSCSIFPKSKYLGYQENCLEFQNALIDSVLKETIGNSRYDQLYDLYQCNINYKILVVLDVDSNGLVKNLIIRDEKKFFFKEEEENLFFKISSMTFNVCLSDPEYRNLSKNDLFKDRLTIRYGLFLPIKK